VDRALQRIGLDDRRSALVGEQVDRVRGMVPEQVVGPAAGFAQGIDIAAAEEIGLYIELLQIELAGNDLLMHILVARIEAPRVTAHRYKTAAARQLDHSLCTGE